MKESQKCDSLKVAYFSQSLTLDSLIISNNKMFKDFELEREKKEAIQLQLQEKETDLNKLFQKPNKGWLIPVLVGITTGVILSSAL